MPYYWVEDMNKDPQERSGYDEALEAGGAGAPENEQDDSALAGQPVCPNCGWRSTRPSHTKKFLDGVLRAFSFRPYRCRSCGNRFRVIRRTSQY